MMMSAPARRMAVSASSAAVRSSKAPARAAWTITAILPADVVGGERQVDLGTHPGDDVEAGERRLDDNHVGALGDVEQRLAHRLAGVGHVHLVAAPVAGAGGAVWAASRKGPYITVAYLAL